MRKIISQLKQFAQEDFNWKVYLTVGLFLIISLILNYQFGLTDAYVYGQPNAPKKFLAWLVLMGVPYLFVLGAQAMFGQSAPGVKTWAFWRLFLVAMLMICITATFPYHRDLSRYLFPRQLYRWSGLVFWNLKRVIFMFIPMLIYWFTFQRKENRFYGMFEKPKNLMPYFVMLLIMLPIVAIASFSPSFIKAYPQYMPGNGEVRLGISKWLTCGIFEAVYGFDFILVELMFRGFLVIGLVKILGTRAILPMVAMYCFLHFGKPAGEAIGSIFGGLILGIVAYYGKNIWGGVVVHLGIAWMMEAAAHLQRGLG